MDGLGSGLQICSGAGALSDCEDQPAPAQVSGGYRADSQDQEEEGAIDLPMDSIAGTLTPPPLTYSTPSAAPTDASSEPGAVFAPLNATDQNLEFTWGEMDEPGTGFTDLLDIESPTAFQFTSSIGDDQPPLPSLQFLPNSLSSMAETPTRDELDVSLSRGTPVFSFDFFLRSDEACSNTSPPAIPVPTIPDHNTMGPEETNTFSQFGSRLPSVQPDETRSAPDRQTTLSEAIDLGDSHAPEFPDLIEFSESDIYPSESKTKTRSRTHAKESLSPLTTADRKCILERIAEFSTVPASFQLPTRLSLARYIRGYIDGFHEHLPFLHIPSMKVETSSVELLLAMAAVGSQYCFEADKGVELFNAARAIATERIRRRDVRIASYSSRLGRHPESSCSDRRSSRSSMDSTASAGRPFSRQSGPCLQNAPLELQRRLSTPITSPASTAASDEAESLMQTAQALLILMAMATWGKHKEILREAMAIQSILGSLVREDGLRDIPRTVNTEGDWESWNRSESILRTKYIVYCFFNLHSIVYDIPPLILNSEIDMRLPSSASEFKASTATEWRDMRERGGTQPTQFQRALRGLFSGTSAQDCNNTHSSLGNYILIHAIIQQIFLVRQTARGRFDSSSDLPSEDIAPLEQALRSWQLCWERSPESSLDPMNSDNPVSFNSTALLRLAYVRLNMNTGPSRALGTRDPVQIAHALKSMPLIQPTPKLMRALLHSVHALSIPVKIGVRLVARMQTFIWSIQHSLCSLECALLLSKWLEAVSAISATEPLTKDEERILLTIRTMLAETDFSVAEGDDSRETARYLNVGVLRVWASIFRGSQTWAVVDIIGTSLDLYADMLDTSTVHVADIS